jgi:hypothetical protein
MFINVVGVENIFEVEHVQTITEKDAKSTNEEGTLCK